MISALYQENYITFKALVLISCIKPNATSKFSGNCFDYNSIWDQRGVWHSAPSSCNHSFEQEIDIAVAKIRKIVWKIRKSCVKSELLRRKCVKSGAKFTTLMLDCRTRWNSFADVLDRYTSLQNVVKSLLEEYDYPQDYQLTRRETNISNKYVKLFKWSKWLLRTSAVATYV